ncbi:MAG: hypothetical protein WBW51_08750 [Methyloceanibacter sp.]
MHRAALLGLGVWLAAGGLAHAQGLPEGTFASSKEGCAKLKEKTVTELGQDLDFTVFSKAGVSANAQRCDFVGVTPRNATSWLATAFCEEPGYAFPDIFAIVQKKTGDLSITRMTVQQESYDESEDESSAFSEDLDPAEIDRREREESEAAGGDNGDATTASQDEEDLNALFRCENVKP